MEGRVIPEGYLELRQDQSARPFGSAPARLLRRLRARLVARRAWWLGAGVLSQGERPAHRAPGCLC